MKKIEKKDELNEIKSSPTRRIDIIHQLRIQINQAIDLAYERAKLEDGVENKVMVDINEDGKETFPIIEEFYQYRQGKIYFTPKSGEIIYYSPKGNKYSGRFNKGFLPYELLKFFTRYPKMMFPLNLIATGVENPIIEEGQVRAAIEGIKKGMKLTNKKDEGFFAVNNIEFGVNCDAEQIK